MTYTISSSKFKSKVSGTFCMVPLVADAYADDENITVVSSGCSSVTLENEDVGRSAMISFSYKKDEFTQTIAYNDTTCQLTSPMPLRNEPTTCSDDAEEDEYFERMDAFGNCLDDSGYYDDFGIDGVLLKGKGKLSASVEKALKRARPF